MTKSILEEQATHISGTRQDEWQQQQQQQQQQNGNLRQGYPSSDKVKFKVVQPNKFTTDKKQ